PGPALRSGGGDARRWGRSVADMAALRDQPELFRDVASAPMTWRAVHEVDAAVLTDRHRRGNRQQADNSQGLLVHRGCAGAPAGEVVPEPVHRRRARRHRPTDAPGFRSCGRFSGMIASVDAGQDVARWSAGPKSLAARLRPIW